MHFCLKFVVFALFLVGSIGASTKARAADPVKRPNVLMIAVDDLRPTFGCYGHPEIKTPNLDKLAAGGFLYERAYVMQAVCSPSRTSLLTGRRPDTTKIYDLQTHFRKNLPDIVTLPQAFKEAGYYTQSFGKIYHGGLDDPQSWSAPSFTPKGPPAKAAAQSATATQSKPQTQSRAQGKPKAQASGKAGAKKKPQAVGAGNRKVLERDPKTGLALKLGPNNRTGRGPAWESLEAADDELADGKVAARAIEVLREVKDKPFFLAVGFVKPHLPFVAPKRYYDLYSAADIKLPANPYPPKGVTEFSLTNGGELRTYAGVPQSGPVSDEMTRQLIHGYYAAASFTDAQIGRVLDELERLGLADDTIVCMWGDHGWKLGDHGSWCKHTNFEIDTHAPLIFRVPGHKQAGSKVPALAEFVDVMPTLCELAGVAVPEGGEGTSLVPTMTDPQRPWKSAAFSQYPRDKIMGYSMRTDRYRYTEWQNKQGEAVARELYDHETDPDENVNVAGDKAQADLVAQLSKQLAAGWQAARPK